MNKTEIATIKNVIKRLKKPNCGCSNKPGTDEIVAAANAIGIAVVSRLYIDSWIIPALELLVDKDRTIHDLQLAESISRSHN